MCGIFLKAQGEHVELEKKGVQDVVVFLGFE